MLLADSSFFFSFVTYMALFSSMTKQHRQDPAPGLPACAMIQQVVKRRNVFFFGKGWERNGKYACVCVYVYLTSWWFCDFSRNIMLSCSRVGVNNLFQKKGLKDIWWKNEFA